jgi:hypothetical protein
VHGKRGQERAWRESRHVCRKKHAGSQASRSSQADIKSDAGRCIKVKETKESIGLAGKQPSKQKKTGN